MSKETRSVSPTSSPQSSPKAQTQRDHAKSDMYLITRYKKSTHLNRLDNPPVSPFSEYKTPDLNRSQSTEGISRKDKKKRRSKKKSALNSTNKNRSEDFKLLFEDVPDDERLVFDYSCALKNEILLPGRMYISQNYLCFYANISGRETKVSVEWKNVTAITKEKTALVIPSALLITTRNDKYVFTSFASRDKTYLMLFRAWQNAFMERPINQQEMRKLIHESYGAELRLASNAEDHITLKRSLESYSEGNARNAEGTSNDQLLKQDDDNQSQSPSESRFIHNLALHVPNGPIRYHLPPPAVLTPPRFSCLSGNDSDSDNNIPVCSALHEGRQLLNEVIPTHVDQVFKFLFTGSKFFKDFHASRKSADLTQTTWTHNADNKTKNRVITLTVPTRQSVGPKTAKVTETQEMLPCSKDGHLYSIDVVTVNRGIPYADSFCIQLHYCMHKISDTQSSLAVYAQVKFKKFVGVLVKGLIEKNCWQGLEDFFTCLGEALIIEAKKTASTTAKRMSLQWRRQSIQRPSSKETGRSTGK